MSNAPKKLVWHADPHTLAKIQIVEKYLYRWALITGTTFADKPLTYIDGFAGPGEYSNHPEGSPLVALRALNSARQTAATKWRSSMMRVLFVEQDPARAAHLVKLVEEREAAGEVKCVIRNDSFDDALERAEHQYSKAFFTSAPLLVFIDPFGATGFPWSAIAKILRSKTSEIILNFDADGMARIALAGSSANADEVIATIFGDDEWKAALIGANTTQMVERALLGHYKQRLRSLPNVDYIFSFAMIKKGSPDYFLLFASQHRLGLVKMKESMKELDQTGGFQFSDADVHQRSLFRSDDIEIWLEKLVQHFKGQRVKFRDVDIYILCETPFNTPGPLLYVAQERALLEARMRPGAKRARKNIFKESEILEIQFRS